jgi:transcriptional regulator with XRE-family HTH domain
MAKRIHPAESEQAYRDTLREMRLRAGLHQKELAAALGREQAWWSRVERGVRRLDVLELREVCRACGTTAEEFCRKLDERIGSGESTGPARRLRSPLRPGTLHTTPVDD